MHYNKYSDDVLYSINEIVETTSSYDYQQLVL